LLPIGKRRNHTPAYTNTYTRMQLRASTHAHTHTTLTYNTYAHAHTHTHKHITHIQQSQTHTHTQTHTHKHTHTHTHVNTHTQTHAGQRVQRLASCPGGCHRSSEGWGQPKCGGRRRKSGVCVCVWVKVRVYVCNWPWRWERRWLIAGLRSYKEQLWYITPHVFLSARKIRKVPSISDADVQSQPRLSDTSDCIGWHCVCPYTHVLVHT